MNRFEHVTQTGPADRAFLEERVRRFCERRVDSDFQSIAALIAPDIAYSGTLPSGGALVRRGREAFIELARAIDVNFEELGGVIEAILIDGEKAAVRRIVRVRNRGTGRTGDVTICAFFTFCDGLIVEMTEAFDTQAGLRLGEFP